MVTYFDEMVVRCNDGLSWSVKLYVRMMCVCMNENGIVFLHIFSLKSTGECIHHFSLIVYSLWKNVARFVWARFTSS